MPRRGFPPTDGPDTYTAGTLFPRSSKKVARAINAASGNRPVVVLANLSGFDGSPESMRSLQLEYGAEIGRAIVNFDGPIVFTVVSRYHGGAFVVFSKTLNPRMTVLAVEGSFASVLGGAPAAAVVFSRDVDARTASDPRVAELEGRLGRGLRGASGRASPPSSPSCARRCAPRSSARSPRSSTRCTASTAPSRSARSTPSSTPHEHAAAHHRRHRGGPAGLTRADHEEGVCRELGSGGIRRMPVRSVQAELGGAPHDLAPGAQPQAPRTAETWWSTVFGEM